MSKGYSNMNTKNNILFCPSTYLIPKNNFFYFKHESNILMKKCMYKQLLKSK